MDIIRNGYGLPFTSIPQDCFIENNKSALMHPKFVEDAIIKFLEVGCIQEVSEAVDALVQDWSHEINWVCPPIYLIPKVIRHMKRCRAKGVLIVPEWHSGLFWPVLCKNQYEFEHFVKDVFVLGRTWTNICIQEEKTGFFRLPGVQHVGTEDRFYLE